MAVLRRRAPVGIQETMQPVMVVTVDEPELACPLEVAKDMLEGVPVRMTRVLHELRESGHGVSDIQACAHRRIHEGADSLAVWDVTHVLILAWVNGAWCRLRGAPGERGMETSENAISGACKTRSSVTTVLESLFGSFMRT